MTKELLEQRIESLEMKDTIFQVLVPKEKKIKDYIWTQTNNVFWSFTFNSTIDFTFYLRRSN